MGIFLALIVAAIVLVILGALFKGLLYLLAIGLIVLVVAVVYGAVRRWRGNSRTGR